MIEYVSKVGELKLVTETLDKYLIQPGAILALDLETYGPNKNQIPQPTKNADGSYNGHIRTLQLGLDMTNPSFTTRDIQFVIDIHHLGYKRVAKELKPYLEKSIILGQNLKYDWRFLWEHMGIYVSRILDTMLLSKLVSAGDKMSHDFAELCDRLLGYAFMTAYTKMTPKEFAEFKESMQTCNWAQGDLTPEMLTYAAYDVSLIFYIYEKLIEKIEAYKNKYQANLPINRSIFSTAKLEMQCLPVFASMEQRGILLDMERHKSVMRFLASQEQLHESALGFTRIKYVKKNNGKRKPGLKKEWIEEIVEPLNMRSPKQLLTKMNELIAEYTDKTIPATGEDEIADFLTKYGSELPPHVLQQFKHILNYKKASSLQSKFGEALLEHALDTGYVHPSWHQAEAESGRTSCTKPNVQQAPSRGIIFGQNALELFRRTYIAPSGMKLICSDFAQEEPCIAAEFCGVKWLVDKYASGEPVDIHGYIAKALMALDEAPKKGTFERDYIGKTAGLSLLYGKHWKGLKDFMYTETDGKVNWTEDEARRAYENFFEMFPEFRKKMQWCETLILERPKAAGETLKAFKDRSPFAVINTLGGRPRGFYLRSDHLNLPDSVLKKNYIYQTTDAKGKVKKERIYNDRISSANRAAFNHFIQGTAADILKTAIILIHNRFIEAGFDFQEGIIAVIHDEVLAQVKIEHVDQAKKIIEDSMVEAGAIYLKKVPLRVDCHVGDNWAWAKQGEPKEALELSLV